MNIDALDSRMQYIERNGCCLNIDEKMKLQIAFSELERPWPQPYCLDRKDRW